MGRGGAKLGKEVKGAGLLNHADRAALIAGLTPPSIDHDGDAADPSDIPQQIARRDALLTAFKAKAADNTDPIAARHADVKWRAFLRIYQRQALLARVAAQRFDLDRVVLVDDLRRRNLTDDTDALAAMTRGAASRHLTQMGGLAATFTQHVADHGRVVAVAMACLYGTLDAEGHVTSADHVVTKRGMDATLQAGGKERSEGDEDSTAKLEMEREQIRGANVEAINELRVVLDCVVDSLEQRFEAAHAAYVHGTEGRQHEFRALYERDAVLSADIGKRLVRVDDAAHDIALWRKKTAKSGTRLCWPTRAGH